ncbi:MAG: peptide chain release factor N(5)-glutamine methyltransferase [Bacteroidia bacterium]|nr:peptide chain release factor N(5)-glutamine methyltransferase [Sphingobacteriaceae bacterium]MBP9067948.1 peptide chain release factor N(5)-glutamine methyltransferase [Bacteroidia bacterium]
MRVAGNKVKHLVSFFQSELSKLYSKDEINELSFRVFEHFLNFKREDLLLREEELINQSELLLIYDAVKELATAKPLQYVLGEAYFYKYTFEVNEHVLIPRPETEELVEIIYKENKEFTGSILDMGTGSGCIPISLKCLLPKAKVEACDISDEALALAKRNAERNKAEVMFFKDNILEFASHTLHYDIIVSNPPYIKLSESDQIHDNVKKHEPHLALFVDGNDAIVFYKKIIDLCETNLNSRGKLYFELNPLTAHDVKAYAESKKLFTTIELKKDLSGNLRFLKAVKR